MQVEVMVVPGVGCCMPAVISASWPGTTVRAVLLEPHYGRTMVACGKEPNRWPSSIKALRNGLEHQDRAISRQTIIRSGRQWQQSCSCQLAKDEWKFDTADGSFQQIPGNDMSQYAALIVTITQT